MNKQNIELYRLQRTREVGGLSSLMPNDMLDERKNQSETFHVGNMFTRLLDEKDDIDRILLQRPDQKQDNRIFEYKPQLAPEVPEDANSNHELPIEDLKFTDPQSPEDESKLNFYEDEGEIQPRIRHKSPALLENNSDFGTPKSLGLKSLSSNEAISIKKVDDLNIDQLGLLDEEDPCNQNNIGIDGLLENQFSGHVDENFLKQFNQEIKNLGHDIDDKEDDIESLGHDNNDLIAFDNKEKDQELSQESVDDNLLEQKYHEPVSKDQEEVIDSLKPDIYVPKVELEQNISIGNNEPQDLPTGFSPQNIAEKLMNSLKIKQDQLANTNDMLIYDDRTEEKKIEIEVKPKNPKADSTIFTGSESLSDSIVNTKDITPDPLLEKEKLVDELYSQLLEELKSSLFPERGNTDQVFEVSDPNSYSTTVSKSPYAWLGTSQNTISKYAFESDKGIGTDFSVLDQYLKDVIDEIMKNESTFINNILTPIQRDYFDMLRLLQTSEIGNYSHFDTYDPIQPILGDEIYLAIEHRREQEKAELGQVSDRSETDSLVNEAEHIHNKNIFDCINESLNQFRPYGKEGVPMLWSNKLRKLREDEILEFSKMFEIIKQDLFRWSYTAAGTLPKREYFNEESNTNQEANQVANRPNDPS